MDGLHTDHQMGGGGGAHVIVYDQCSGRMTPGCISTSVKETKEIDTDTFNGK